MKLKTNAQKVKVAAIWQAILKVFQRLWVHHEFIVGGWTQRYMVVSPSLLTCHRIILQYTKNCVKSTAVWNEPSAKDMIMRWHVASWAEKDKQLLMTSLSWQTEVTGWEDWRLIIIVTYFSFGYHGTQKNQKYLQHTWRSGAWGWIYLVEQLKKKIHNKGSMENIDICLLWFDFGLPKDRSSDISINVSMMIDVDRII